MTARNADLEAEIAKSPDDPAPYLVYADWLAERGDPRGELITVEVQLAKAPTPELEARAKALHVKHDAEWLDELGRQDGFHAEWRYGFLHRVAIGGERGSGWGAPEIDHGDTYAKLRPLPAAAFLRELTFGGFQDDDGQPSWEAATAALVEHGAVPTLKSLAYDRGSYWDISWTYGGSLAPIYATLPQLESLRLALGHFELGAIDLPHLRSFETYTGGFTAENMREVLHAKWPQLERLILRFGNNEDYGGDCTLEDALPLLEAALPKLRHLGIGNAGFVNAFVEHLATSPLLNQLATLDLSMGALGDEGASAIVAHAAAFRHLQHLDVSNSYVSDELVEQLRRVVPNLEAGMQNDADGDDDAEHRFCQIGE